MTNKPVGDTPPKRRLKTHDDCRRFLADLVNRLNRGEIDPGVAGKLGYLVNILTGIITGNDLEKRLAELEEKIASEHKGY